MSIGRLIHPKRKCSSSGPFELLQNRVHHRQTCVNSPTSSIDRVDRGRRSIRTRLNEVEQERADRKAGISAQPRKSDESALTADSSSPSFGGSTLLPGGLSQNELNGGRLSDNSHKDVRVRAV